MRSRWNSLLALSIVLWAAKAHAQSDNLTIVIPSTLAVPNYNRIGLGQREMLEGGAFVARSDDGGACWYNPAGLVQPEKSVLNASANAYDWTTFILEGSGQKTTGSAFNANASLVAGVLGSPIIDSRDWRVGFASVRPVNWQPGTADFAVQGSTASGNENASFVSTADFSQLMTAAGAGFRVAPNLRLGLALEGWWTSITQSLVLHDMIVGGTVQTLTRSYAVNGGVAHAGVSGGVQWDLTPSWTLGAMVRSPGLKVFGSALVRYDTQLNTGLKQGGLAFRDEEADLDYKIPTHIGAGLAHTFAHGGIEFDIRYDASTSEYSLVSSDAAGTASVDSSGTVTTSAVSLGDIRNQAASVLGFAVGGHYTFSRALLLHAGFFSDPSPVEDQTKSFFRQIDILGFTTGLEMRGEKFSGSLGLGYNWGDSGPVRTGGLLGGQIVSPSLTIHTLSLTYAVSFQF
jgi:hypothetical protein